MTERAERLARAEQIIAKHIEDRQVPQPDQIIAAAAHAQAIATVELARAARAGVLIQIIDHPAAYQALTPEHHRALLTELRDFVATIPREEPQP